jgi:ketosteroid isomerase-like protein
MTNIEIIFTDYLDAIRRGDVEAVAARLAPQVSHHGVRDDLVCPDRAAVIASLQDRARDLPAVEAIELVAAGDHVVLSVRAPSVGMPVEADADPEARRGRASIVFTLRDGLITLMQDYPSRTEALAAAGARPDVWT